MHHLRVSAEALHCLCTNLNNFFPWLEYHVYAQYRNLTLLSHQNLSFG